ncbi:hypothetical protein ACH5RR_040814 [Cinchona calisaya]|uniref:Uncharacterized protein n=1 Tax=Cinchona calisaya TaxID=153742 RepID=A0ABD2XUU6_9GENT
MALLLDLVSTTIVLVTKPLSLVKLSCLIGLRSIFIIIQTWIELLRATIYFQLTILWKVIIWAIAILSLPVRALTALQREKMLEIRILEMQTELENMVLHRKKLEEQLQLAIKECRLMEALLEELEDEHDEAICKMELLDVELRDLKVENHRLKEVQGKAFWSCRGQDEGDSMIGQNAKDAGKFGIPLLRSSYSANGFKAQHASSKDRNRSKSEMHEAGREVSEVSGLVLLHSQDTVALDFGKNNVLEHRREVALCRSLFSATLSLLVGMIVWEARDPCMPLVVALFTVVGMSLMSVIQFFSTIENKPAIDAVALLSLNWFILGTLTYPTLPKVANLLLTLVFHALVKIEKWWFAFLT